MEKEEKDIKQRWKEYISSQLRHRLWHDSHILIESGKEPFDLIHEALKAGIVTEPGFQIVFWSLVNQPLDWPKVISLLKDIENYDRYYSLELYIKDEISCNYATEPLFKKILQSKNCKINSLKMTVKLSYEDASAALMFKELLKKNTTITDLKLTMAQQTTVKQPYKKWMAGIKSNKTIQRLKLHGIEYEHETTLAKNLAANHTITALDLEGHCVMVDHLVPALTKMGSLKSLKLRSMSPMQVNHEDPKHVANFCNLIQHNKNLESLLIYYKIDDTDSRLPKEGAELLASTITAHPSLRKLALSNSDICPVIKALAGNTTLTAVGISVVHLTKDKELQKSLLMIKSLRKLILFSAETKSKFDSKENIKFDLSSLVHPSSQIQTLICRREFNGKPAKRFIEFLSDNTSIRCIKFKPRTKYWKELSSPSKMNPFLKNVFSPKFFNRHDDERLYQLFATKSISNRFSHAIRTLNLLRTIYLPVDRGLFAPIPDEILLLIWKEVFSEETILGRPKSYQEDQLMKLIWIAKDRSKLGKEPDTITRLKTLWIEDDLRSMCLDKQMVL